MARIFISYRHKDTSGIALTLFRELSKVFGQGEVFYDIDAGRLPGMWTDRLEKEAHACKTMVVLIGKNWLTPSSNEIGKNWLTPPFGEIGKNGLTHSVSEHVRRECQIALENNAEMIPTIIEESPVPLDELPGKLPKEIRRLFKYSTITIRQEAFDDDLKRLVARIDPNAAPKKSGWSELLGDVLAIAAGQRPGAGALSDGRTSALARTIPGLWQLQIRYPNGMSGNATATFEPGGNFHAEGRGPTPFRIDGSWQADNASQISLRGRQHDGYQMLPYHAVVGFSDVRTNAMVGALNTGETTVWHRIQ